MSLNFIYFNAYNKEIHIPVYAINNHYGKDFKIADCDDHCSSRL